MEARVSGRWRGARRVGTAVAVLALAGCANQAEMNLQRLLEAHAAARGGAGRLENLHSIRVNLEITEPGFTVTGKYVATRGGHARIDIYAGKTRVFTEAVTPTGSWQLRQDETAAIGLSPDGEAALRQGIVNNLYALHELPELGYELHFAGRQEFGGGEYWVIERSAPGGTTRRLFVDPVSYLIAAESETRALHPDVDPTPVRQATRFDDHRATAGIVTPWKAETRVAATGEMIQQVEIQAVMVNPVIDPAVFDRPR